MNRPAPSRVRLYDEDDLDSVLRSMARQAMACLPASEVALVGIQRRGEPLAQRLQLHLQALTGAAPLPLYPIKVKRYADDLSLLHAHTQLTENPELAKLDLAATTLLVVDDVLYEGHSLLRTCAYLAELGARHIISAVLVDRHVCHQPVHADIVGIHLQVAAQDIVECHVPPTKVNSAWRWCAMAEQAIPSDSTARCRPDRQDAARRMADKPPGGIADQLGPTPGLHGADHHHIGSQRSDMGLDDTQRRTFAEESMVVGDAVGIGQRIERQLQRFPQLIRPRAGEVRICQHGDWQVVSRKQVQLALALCCQLLTGHHQCVIERRGVGYIHRDQHASWHGWGIRRYEHQRHLAPMQQYLVK